MEVPSVLPSKTPDQISGTSSSCALRDDLRLSRPAAAQIGQQIVDAQRQAGRTAVDDGDIAGAMADAGGGDAKQFAEGVAWHGIIVTDSPSSQVVQFTIVQSLLALWAGESALAHAPGSDPDTDLPEPGA